MSVDERFADAQVRVKGLTSRPSNEDLLALYALYKQASDGDVSGKKPGMFDLKGRAKWDAWTKKKGLSSEDAKVQYIALVDKLAS